MDKSSLKKNNLPGESLFTWWSFDHWLCHPFYIPALVREMVPLVQCQPYKNENLEDTKVGDGKGREGNYINTIWNSSKATKVKL